MKMGGMEGIMGMMPGMGKMAKQVAEAGFDDRILGRQIALIQSMTKQRTRQSRRSCRPAASAASPPAPGARCSELNQLLKMHRQMADMMKKMGKMGKGGMLKQAMKGMLGKAGTPDANDPAAMHEAARQIQSKMPGLAASARLAACSCRRACPGSARRNDRRPAYPGHQSDTLVLCC